MAEPQFNAPLRAPAGAPTSGVIHVRTRLAGDFTVIANALLQRRGSAVTVGVAGYILSLPDGAPVRIDALCEHFTEGEILISRALRELEAEGYLERRRERGPSGRLRTRTFFHDVPPGDDPERPRPRPRRPEPLPRPAPEPSPRPAPGTEPHHVPDHEPEPAAAAKTATTKPGPVAPEPTGTEPGPAACPAAQPAPDPRASVILASLRIVDRRLILSRREADQLAPAVTRWLEHGVSPDDITTHLTTRLPDPLRARPARILAYRLGELPPPLPDRPTAPAALPWQTCDGGCERAFRAAEPGRCRDCPPVADLASAC
ncbi:hypothetical protein GLX30_19830 [Streptomyces sp. Tu 2975]|uniref:hypothetical protein n=1 Tax=Streptomyces sp. Tu 2975 TaxID=2676871 RepID=UPI001357B01F|nr:hypothetical protein [Streptomyces sp. Tu 2975]QIP85906.1 hypothetical protein GLX30_19830 [Streptomyces sp. Tu 2975]